jgi:hypothetical protein
MDSHIIKAVVRMVATVAAVHAPVVLAIFGR